MTERWQMTAAWLVFVVGGLFAAIATADKSALGLDPVAFAWMDVLAKWLVPIAGVLPSIRRAMPD